MNPLKTLRAVGLAAGVAVAMAGAAQSAAITPTFDTFGSLPAATFGGSGIPNDAVAITTIIDGGNTITLGMTATQRFVNPPLGNDGAGTFSAMTGANFGDPSMMTMPSGTLGATWNFGFYIDIAGGGMIGDYIVELLYDLDPGAGTDEGAHGSINFNTVLGGALSGLSLIEGSENPLFGFLTVPVAGIIPPAGTFDPFAAGEYTFALRVSRFVIEPTGIEFLGESSIRVNVVPEPGTLAIFGLGLAGLGLARRKRMI